MADPREVIEAFGARIFHPSIKLVLKATGWSNFQLARRAYYAALVLVLFSQLAQIARNDNQVWATFAIPLWLWIVYGFLRDCHRIESMIEDGLENITQTHVRAIHSNYQDKFIWMILLIINLSFFLPEALLGTAPGSSYIFNAALALVVIGLYAVTYIQPRRKSWARQAVDKLREVQITLPRLVPSPLPA